MSATAPTDAVEAAILRTVLYADVFNFPLTIDEIHHFLIHDEPVSLATIQHTLLTSTFLAQVLTSVDECVACAGREDLIPVRRERERVSALLWAQAQHYGVWLARLPFIRMVALTGALAVHNAADETDDLDYLLVTTPGRVWLGRALAVVLVRLVRWRRGVVICPNYVLSTNALVQRQRSLFMAREIVQMVPFYGQPTYTAMRDCNDWVMAQLPNATGVFYDEPECRVGHIWRALKAGAEWLLSGWFGDRLEHWEYRRKLKRFAPDMRTPNNAARLDPEHVKGHFNDYGHPVMQRYCALLHEYGLLDEPVPAAGD